MDEYGRSVKPEDTLKKGTMLPQKILFDSNSAALSETGKRIAGEVVEILKKHPGVKLYVEGHADSTGPAENNRSLSKQRSKAVVDYMLSIDRSLAADRLMATGYGQDRTAESNNTESGRRTNRRVEFVVQ